MLREKEIKYKKNKAKLPFTIYRLPFTGAKRQ